ncbi:hypothetical protein VOLCADRAFT_118649 [Volvox carteri f. nagariensis]|uniref:Uncharacterized protein n=1 Tax=Volvox carteri f. nagariensis TaxID=3068 RepID=D8U6D9_VOLCA|nr:uncharacterized protein VOLCADRAFT_118649 [Volvox carteri f. nagariensis]EFJ44627.1 hypothetical protein VOLCADRAFT_118649 [Volvox carteri f. nagariensis]|eukprot:XP_002954203.1 hypothetical protein VOLCADRAFT_118649 [Volvox carteri f. nagariensis]
MESVGRMTRSRAKALAATPLAALPAKTPEPKTTSRRRKGATRAQEQHAQEAAPKQLQFHKDAASQQPTIDQQRASTESSEQLTSDDPQASQTASDITAPASNPDDSDTQAETHDNPSVLMASPIILAHKDQSLSSSIEPFPLNLTVTASAPETIACVSCTANTQPEPAASPLRFQTQTNIAISSLPAADSLDLAQPVADSPLSIATDSPMCSPLPLDASLLPAMNSPLPAAFSPLPAVMEASPLGGILHHHHPLAPSPPPGTVAAPPEGSPMGITTPLSFTSDAPQNGVMAFVQPLPASIPASPLSLTAEAIDEAIFSPLPEDGPGDSPISLSGAVELSSPQLMAPLQPQLLHGVLEMEGMHHVDDDDAMMADATPLAPDQLGANAVSPPTFASDRRAATPGTGPSPAPAFAGAPPDSVPHASASPAPVLSSFQGFAAVFSTPAGSELEPDSPSLAGLMSTAAAAAPSPSMFLFSASASDVAVASMPTPSTLILDHASAEATGTDSACAAAPSPIMTVDYTGALSTTAVMVTPTLDIAGASAENATTQCTAANTTVSPQEGVCLPPAPAPTPESGALPGWTLSQTPLANALAVSLSGHSEAKCVDAGCEENDDQEMEAEVETDDDDEEDDDEEGAEEYEVEAEADDENQQLQVQELTQLPIGSPVEDMDMEDQPQIQKADTPAPPAATRTATAQQPTPAAAAPGARTPAFQGRSPAVGPAFRTGTAKPTPIDKASTKASVTPGSRPGYVTVESRYQRTPTTGSTAARPRPSLAAATSTATTTNTAAVAKSVKRVSIHTPEGLRTVGVHRHVVPTPFRPKSAQVLAPPQPPPQDQASNGAAVADAVREAQPEQPQQPFNPQTVAVAEERRAKAAERLKAIHATEQGPASVSATAARQSSGPGYLAPTAAFAVKASAKPLKSKVETGHSDPRSLRQLRRDVKEAVAKKEAKAALTEVRNTKLISKEPERQLPMPDDDEGSDDQAEYNEGQENDLVAAMTGLEGRHLRFNDKGTTSESPQRTVLRGLPVAVGKYKRFD